LPSPPLLGDERVMPRHLEGFGCGSRIFLLE
jgi:hypothetical protein